MSTSGATQGCAHSRRNEHGDRRGTSEPGIVSAVVALVAFLYLLISQAYFEVSVYSRFVWGRDQYSMSNDVLPGGFTTYASYRVAVIGAIFQSTNWPNVQLLVTDIGVVIRSPINNLCYVLPYQTIDLKRSKVVRNAMLPFQTGLFISHEKPNVPRRWFIFSMRAEKIMRQMRLAAS